jgi:hypothetical protein
VDYREGGAKDRYDEARALDPALVLGFIFTPRRRRCGSACTDSG